MSISIMRLASKLRCFAAIPSRSANLRRQSSPNVASHTGEASFIPVSIDLATHIHDGVSHRHAHMHPKS